MITYPWEAVRAYIHACLTCQLLRNDSRAPDALGASFDTNLMRPLRHTDMRRQPKASRSHNTETRYRSRGAGLEHDE